MTGLPTRGARWVGVTVMTLFRVCPSVRLMITQSRFKAIVTDQRCIDLLRYLLSSRARATRIGNIPFGQPSRVALPRTISPGVQVTSANLKQHWLPFSVTFLNASSRRTSVPIVTDLTVRILCEIGGYDSHTRRVSHPPRTALFPI